MAVAGGFGDGVGGGGAGDGGDVGLGQGAAGGGGVDAGKHQELREDPFGADEGGFGLGDGGRGLGRAGAGDEGQLRADRGEGGAKLVARIAGEVAQRRDGPIKAGHEAVHRADGACDFGRDVGL